MITTHEQETTNAIEQVDAKEVKIVISNVIPMTTKIIEYKLNGRDYLDCSKIIGAYLHSIERDDHLTDESLSNAVTKKAWLRENAKIFL